MSKKMLINASEPAELRVAMVEDGTLSAFYTETASAEQSRANIYKGVVSNVEPSLDAAFVDYGAGKNGFLQINDLNPVLYGKPWEGKGLPPINQVLSRGRELMVQVVKEENARKGAALTTYLSIPGQYLVLTPGRSGQGVSRQIESEKERGRLKKILAELKRPEDAGVIARTAAEKRTKKELTSNLNQLLKLWGEIEKQYKKARPPALVHKEEGLAVRTVRDLFTSDVNEILVDSQEVFDQLERFLDLTNPQRKNVLKLWPGGKPIFGKYQIEDQIRLVFTDRVPLTSGGSIVIQPTEALVSVDVNSHKAVSGGQIEDTALAVNLEAAAEVARQLRLRDLGGLIVIDFIDMRDSRHKSKVRKALMDGLKPDKAKTTVGTISRFGLMEMSRQRIRPPVDFGSVITCPTCAGRGTVRTPEALGLSALRSLRTRMASAKSPGVKVFLAPGVADFLQNQRRADLAALEMDTGCCLAVGEDPSLREDELKVEPLEQGWLAPPPSAPAPASVSAATPAPVEQAAAAPETAKKDEGQAPAKSKSSSRKRRRRRKSNKKKAEAAAPE